MTDFILYLNRNPFEKILLDLENPDKLKYFQDNYQGLFSQAFIEALFKYKQENKLKLKISRFFPEISPKHKAILDLDVTEICKYIISSSQQCNGSINLNCFNTFFNLNVDTGTFYTIINIALLELNNIKLNDTQKKEFLLMLIGSEDFVFYDGNIGSSLDKAMESFSHIRISQLYLLQNIGSRISVKNSLKIVRHAILYSRFDQSFLDWLFKDYIYLEH